MCSIIGFETKYYAREDIAPKFAETVSRGPDMSRLVETAHGWLGFHRLAIMDLSEKGMQPFSLGSRMLVCNGEIYGFRSMRARLAALTRPDGQPRYRFSTESDCEILLPLFEEMGTAMFPLLGSEFALIIYDSATGRLTAVRDPLGIRPLYYGRTPDGGVAFASEAKNLTGLCQKIMPFPPGCFYQDGRFERYADPAKVDHFMTGDVDRICAGIRTRLIDAVEARLDADAPLGFLLSGGLDSSLVCAISAKILGRKIRTFAIGMDTDPIDLKYARETADFIGSEHRAFRMTKEDVIAALPDVVHLLGTWDITTVRASIGMYLCCRAIHETTDVKVLMTGEISDELFGYKYTDYAPDAAAFQDEAAKRIREIHAYDVLRADRCISVNSLEGRVPFGDTELVRYVMAIDPEIKRNHYGIGKYLLRHAFEKDGILPDDILWRQKAAFSDAVGHSMVDDLKAYAEEVYTDEEFRRGAAKYDYCRPFTKESLLYRDLFERYYPGQAEMIPAFWMPNASWEGCDVDDPSARVLGNYGDSGR